MVDKWKNRQKPNSDYLLDQMNKSPVLSQFLIGHLAIESLMVQVIDTKLQNPEKFNAFEISFPKKVDLLLAYGIISEGLGKILLEVNKKRNKFAHQLGYDMNYKEIWMLAKFAEECGVDFTDQCASDINFAKSCYDYSCQRQTAHQLLLASRFNF